MSKIFNAKSIIFILFLLTAIFIYWLTNSLFDEKVNDFLTKNLVSWQKIKPSDEVVLVVIDDKSIEKISWPWQRSLFSDIFNYLEHTCGAKTVVFQNVITVTDTYNPKSDEIFYDNLKKQNKLINSFVLFNSNLDIFNLKSNVTIHDKSTKANKFTYKSIVRLPKEFLNNVKNLASAIIVEDKDAILRSYVPIVKFKDNYYPSIALSAYSMYTGKTDFYLYDNYLCDAEDCSNLKIPIYDKKAKDYIDNDIFVTAALLKWYKPQSDYYSHKVYSAIDVLDSNKSIKEGELPKISPDKFKDKIVIVGLNADKNVWEQLSETPVLKKHSDLDVHAVMIDNLLKNEFKCYPQYDYSILITALFCFFIIKGFGRLRNNLIFASIFVLIYMIYYFYEFEADIRVCVIAPVITMYYTALVKALYIKITTDRTSDMIKNIMGKYFSKDVMKKIISDMGTLKSGGVRAVVTILFADIRNFTQIAEKLSPQEVSSILNEYFSIIEPIISKYGGIVNKYMGDGLLAVFGEPIKSQDHAINAIYCASEILQEVKHFRDKLISEGRPKIDIGIGINTGEVFAGNIGSEDRIEYTVIGDNVNLASRIEAYNHILKTQFLISEHTYEFVKDSVEVVKLSQVNIKGKSNPVDIYEVLRIKHNV